MTDTPKAIMNGDSITWKAADDDPPLPLWMKVAVFDRDTGKKVAEAVIEKPVLNGDTVTIDLGDKGILTLE